MAQIEYYMIFRWMREELHLDDTELHCYAIIYSLSKGDNWFNAGVQNIIDVLGKSKPTIINALGSLTKKELVIKVPVLVNNIKRYYYKATRTLDEETLKVLKESGLNNLTKGGLNGLTKGGLNNLTPINKVNNKEVNKKVPNGTKKENAHFQKPTVQEVEAYIKEKGYHFDAERFMSHYESIGWMVGTHKMKDWKAACSTWEKKQKTKLCYEPNPSDSDELKRFKAWMRENHAEIEFTEVPLTLDGYKRLQKDYGRDEVCNQLDYIDANIGKFRQCDIEKSIIQYFERA